MRNPALPPVQDLVLPKLLLQGEPVVFDDPDGDHNADAHRCLIEFYEMRYAAVPIVLTNITP